MTYIPHTTAEREAMLSAVGVKTLDDLFAHLPADIKAPPLTLQTGLGEMELSAEMARRSRRNRSAADFPCFIGAGAYDLLHLFGCMRKHHRVGRLVVEPGHRICVLLAHRVRGDEPVAEIRRKPRDYGLGRLAVRLGSLSGLRHRHGIGSRWP